MIKLIALALMATSLIVGCSKNDTEITQAVVETTIESTYDNSMYKNIPYEEVKDDYEKQLEQDRLLKEQVESEKKASDSNASSIDETKETEEVITETWRGNEDNITYNDNRQNMYNILSDEWVDIRGCVYRMSGGELDIDVADNIYSIRYDMEYIDGTECLSFLNPFNNKKYRLVIKEYDGNTITFTDLNTSEDVVWTRGK